MHTNRWPWVVIAALALVALATLGWQRRTTTELQREITWQHAQIRERARLQTENQRLAVDQPTAAEIDALLAERTAVNQLREQLAALRRRAEDSAATRPTGTPESRPPTPLLTGNVLAYQLWQNLGAATPAAAFETTLWASAGGNIDILAGLLALDPEARTEATALFGQLPEKLRQEFVSPERLVAVLTAKDVPLGSATILGQYPSPSGTKVAAQVFDAEGKQKVSLLSLRNDGDRWQLVVPVNAVKRYAAWLHAPPKADQAAP